MHKNLLRAAVYKTNIAKKASTLLFGKENAVMMQIRGQVKPVIVVVASKRLRESEAMYQLNIGDYDQAD